MGNTEMTKYMAAGAFQDLTSDKASLPNSGTWLAGLAASGRYGGKLYGVPVLRRLARRHVPHRPVQEGRASRCRRASRSSRRRPRSSAIGQHGEGLLARLHRRHRLVLRDELRLRLRRLDRDAGERQVEGHARLAEGRSPGSPPTRTSSRPPRGRARRPTRPIPNPYDVYAQGQAASMVGPGWFSCCVGDKYKSRDEAVRDAEPHGRASRCPASSAAPTSRCPIGANKALAVDWIKAYTSTQSMTALRGIGNIPNTTSLLGSSVNEKAARAELVRPDGEELGQRGERQYPPQHAGPDPHRQAQHQAGRSVRRATTSRRS